ncbi:Undecaprenyl-phosphate galactose phosphotransferase WbaP/exopolysaccharide biosynthesis polyprenyl glycosylphosphotransferase [Curtobacterium flaccumfaciens]|uniref:Undecaprenyl-phosphate galactose phosphotransferase WbaP/exopolysaccharide biosynthesis polyprenyl glycosylphosphotransferase n=1 Tax=Curtobacterium flaccumfaciens TaxID=2035 RepID=A0A4R6DCQ2_9MICO|nr:sugar transferase [Curtobacterium flaccumfaciens]TDN41688.1 Undecaprenyl-phosphate galactose phosphotransferase WbaP/exopolysaccharide biosynthesis polyprenyl glycosylphosphotransferase [Curtobacterium flaccumfaciens]
MSLALRPSSAPGRSGTSGASGTSASPDHTSSVRGRRQASSATATALLDLALLLVAFGVAHLLRFPWELPSGSVDAGWIEFVVAPAIVLVWMALLSAFRTRDPRITGIGGDEYRRLLTASLLAGGSVAVVAYAASIDLARGYVAIAFPLGLLLLALGRKTLRTALFRRRARGERLQQVLLVGDAEDVRYVGRRIAATPTAGYRVRAVVTDCAAVGADIDLDGAVVPVLGGIDDVLDLARTQDVSAVVVAGAVRGGHERLRRLGWQLEEHDVELVVSSPLADIAAGRVHERPVDGLPLMHVETPDYRRRVGKRALDVVGAGLGLLLLAPVFAGIALVIRADDRGPVFFRQIRVGRGGREFSILKFRTMCTDAEARVAALEQANEGAGPLFKMKADPRVTRVGAVLRRTSLDELPQLWNVLTGSMSLVGPRPALPREVALYEDFADRRLLVTPGITGLWQVSGRSDLDWVDGVRLDLHYVENWSFVHDVVILARTIPSVLRSRGAY